MCIHGQFTLYKFRSRVYRHRYGSFLGFDGDELYMENWYVYDVDNDDDDDDVMEQQQ